MNAPKPGGPTLEGPASGRSGSGRPLGRGARDVFAIVCVVTAATIAGGVRLAVGIAASDG